MIYQIKKKYSKVTLIDFLLSNSKLVLRKEKKQLILIDFNIDEEFEIQKESTIFLKFVSNNFVFYKSEGVLYSFDLDKFSEETIGSYDILNVKWPYLLLSYEENKTWTSGIFQFMRKNFLIKFEANSYAVFLNGCAIVFSKTRAGGKVDYNIFEFYDFAKGELKFSVDINNVVETEGEVNELISPLGLYGGKLWLLLNGKRLFALSADDGSIVAKAQLDKLFGVPENDPLRSVGTGDLHLDNKGILKGFGYRYYYEVDLNILKGEIRKDFGEDYKSNWRITRSRYYEGDKNLYFIGAKNGEAVNRSVGVFDTEKCEVVWHDEPLEEKKFLFYSDLPQANDKFLCVLDSENNLWIYER
jgi:hypothetical protein